MKLGISTYTLTWSFGVRGFERPVRPLTPVDLIRIASEHGLSLVQIADNVPLHESSTREIHKLMLAALETNITIEIGTRGTTPAHLLRYLEIARQLDSPLVRTLITQPDLILAEQEIREILPLYERANVILAIENHGLQTAPTLKSLLDRIDSPMLACCLDTVNSYGSLEGPAEVTELLLPFTVNLHLKDYEIVRLDHQMGYEIRGTPAGSGRLNIPLLVEQLQQKGRPSTAILEQWTPYTGSIEDAIAKERIWMQESLTYLKRLNVFNMKEGTK
ncbi:hypothetical protein SY83_22160 [Paenibacillus swuensis]|uniref:Xylose isomerase-like TIM barrel domain-containing protein n=1 Tax=Paenibacillus swuensis TaxID=1178515 RepID=A0A172TN73_9BACL|nr:TIM barrel protein [Paenibacillus swuensis]ANE48539.1 hypothetical protein SY83_22160 [Paenibacillus swuensis]